MAARTKVKEAAPDPDAGLFGKVTPQAKAAPQKKGQVVAQPLPASQTGSAVATLPPPKNMLALIAAAASNPMVDVAKMKELLAMQRELEQAEEAREFNRAMLSAQSEMPRITKDRANDHTKSRYATLEKVSKEIDHIARKHGFTMSFGTADSPLADHYRIVCDLSHGGGCSRRYHVDLQGDSAGAKGTSNKTPIQGVGSTMSYGRRYLKVMMFDLAIVGEDTDGNKRRKGDVIEATANEAALTQEQVVQLIELCEAVGCPKEKLVQHLKVSGIALLPQSRFDEAVTALRSYEANRKERDAKPKAGAQ